MPSQAQRSTLSFDGYRLEIRVGTADGLNRKLALFRGDSKRPENLSPKTLALLEYFVRHPQEELRRDRIHSAIWMDEEDAGGDLDHYIGLLRKALGDNSQQPRFIETIRGHGFKFLLPVHLSADRSRELDGDQQAIRQSTGPLRPGAKNKLDDEQKARAFKEFFGDAAASADCEAPRGAIILQSDLVARLSKNNIPDVNKEFDEESPIRSLKARSWVNRWDLAGAWAIVRNFRSIGSTFQS